MRNVGPGEGLFEDVQSAAQRPNKLFSNLDPLIRYTGVPSPLWVLKKQCS
jgi:hypothetical protein